MKRRMLSLGHIIWMMRRTASKTICLLRWQNWGQIIAVKSVAYISMAYCAQNEWNWSLVIDHNHKQRNFENNISLEQLITTLPHQRVVWQLRPTAPLPNIGLLKKVNKVEPKSCRLRRRGKEFVWQTICPILLLKSNQSRLYLKVQPFEVSRKRKKNSLMDLFNTEEKPVWSVEVEKDGWDSLAKI